jgi:hypothetical protein
MSISADYRGNNTSGNYFDKYFTEKLLIGDDANAAGFLGLPSGVIDLNAAGPAGASYLHLALIGGCSTEIIARLARSVSPRTLNRTLKRSPKGLENLATLVERYVGSCGAAAQLSGPSGCAQDVLESGFSPLHLASVLQRTDFVEALLEASPDPLHPNSCQPCALSLSQGAQRRAIFDWTFRRIDRGVIDLTSKEPEIVAELIAIALSLGDHEKARKLCELCTARAAPQQHVPGLIVELWQGKHAPETLAFFLHRVMSDPRCKGGHCDIP